MAKGNPNPKPGPGRPKGVPNKNTTYVRDMVKLFLENKVDQLDSWLDQVALKDPAEALKIIQGFMEYHVPKIQRTELTGADGGAIQTANIDMSKLDTDTLTKLLAARRNDAPVN